MARLVGGQELSQAPSQPNRPAQGDKLAIAFQGAIAIAPIVTCRPVPDVLRGHDAHDPPPWSAHPLKSVGEPSRSKKAFCDPHGYPAPESDQVAAPSRHQRSFV